MQEGDNDESQISTIFELARMKAAKMARAEKDYELDSIADENEKKIEVYNILCNNNSSHTSSLTDITNNTMNKKY